jgi:hypothetical protein
MRLDIGCVAVWPSYCVCLLLFVLFTGFFCFVRYVDLTLLPVVDNINNGHYYNHMLLLEVAYA